jgi:hypothetical protein
VEYNADSSVKTGIIKAPAAAPAAKVEESKVHLGRNSNNYQHAHEPTGELVVHGFGESCRQGELLLLRTYGVPGDGRLQVRVLILPPELRRDGDDQIVQHPGLKPYHALVLAPIEVQDRGLRAGLENGVNFLQSQWHTGDIAQTVGHGDSVEGRILEWQREGVA